MKQPTIDEETLNILIKSLGQECAQEVVNEFIILSLENIKAAINFLDEENFEEFAKHCHKIKSNIGYLGGKKLEKMCIDIEELNYHKKFNEMKAIESEFKACCKETLDSLENRGYGIV